MPSCYGRGEHLRARNPAVIRGVFGIVAPRAGRTELKGQIKEVLSAGAIGVGYLVCAAGRYAESHSNFTLPTNLAWNVDACTST